MPACPKHRNTWMRLVFPIDVAKTQVRYTYECHLCGSKRTIIGSRSNSIHSPALSEISVPTINKTGSGVFSNE